MLDRPILIAMQLITEKPYTMLRSRHITSETSNCPKTVHTKFHQIVSLT